MSQTVTQTTVVTAPPSTSSHVSWANNTVDNENLGKKKSKKCCIFKKKKNFAESSSDDSDSHTCRS